MTAVVAISIRPAEPVTAEQRAARIIPAISVFNELLLIIDEDGDLAAP